MIPVATPSPLNTRPTSTAAPAKRSSSAENAAKNPTKDAGNAAANMPRSASPVVSPAISPNTNASDTNHMTRFSANVAKRDGGTVGLRRNSTAIASARQTTAANNAA